MFGSYIYFRGSRESIRKLVLSIIAAEKKTVVLFAMKNLISECLCV